jgi:hypothetical protein
MSNLTTLLAMTGLNDRLAGLRDGLAGGVPAWQWWLPAAGAMVAGLLLIYVSRHWYDGRRSRVNFAESAARLGLTTAERTLLAHLAAGAGLRHVDSIYGMAAAFDRGAEQYLYHRQADGLSDEAQAELVAAFDRLRDKLGFTSDAATRRREAARRDVRKAPAAAAPQTVAAICALVADMLPAAAVSGAAALNVAAAVAGRSGESWCVRHVDGEGRQWEFDAAVTPAAGRPQTVRLVGEPRRINLRRSVRTATRLPAFLAPFPFVQGAGGSAPHFVPGTLTEIGGPGLRIASPLQTRVGDRVLAIVRGHDDQTTLQGVAKVRRLMPGADGSWVTVVEMIGLADDEAGALAEQTHLAAARAQSAASFAVPHSVFRTPHSAMLQGVGHD